KAAADISPPDDVPPGELFDWPGRINVYRYGLTQFADLFTPRQLTALTTASDLVGEARERALNDALAAGMEEGAPLEGGGAGAAAYADAVAIYLSCAQVRTAMTDSHLCRWNSTGEKVQHMFGRQAI